MPLNRYQFDLTKIEFRDGIALRYGWDTVKMPSLCECNENFTVAYALHCLKGGYTHMRNNKLRDSLTNLLSHDVEIEPHLQLLQVESFALKSTTNDDDDDARLDIKADGQRIWNRGLKKPILM